MSPEDDATAEIMIMHQPLANVLAFIVDRDDVRRIPAPLAERPELDDCLELPSPPATLPATGTVT